MEKPTVFGEADHLFGIVNIPDTVASRTAVIMLTAGMLHHVGSFRFHVLLARQLEELGLVSFRFDLSGIGESLAAGVAGRSLDRAATEVGHAIDLLSEQHQIENVILFGLCSGADDGWHVAKRDSRVVGLAMIDGLGYPTRMHQRLGWIEKARRLSAPSYWQARLRRNVSPKVDVETLRTGSDIREFPNRENAQQDLREFIDRGLNILACYTGGAKDYYNYAEQFYEMFPSAKIPSSVEVAFLPSMDHVALLKEDRRVLLDLFRVWMLKVAHRSARAEKELARA